MRWLPYPKENYEMSKIRVTVWNEHSSLQECAELLSIYPKEIQDIVADIFAGAERVYPKGIHEAIADLLRDNKDIVVRTSLLKDPEQGLSQNILDGTDVLIWWGHFFHDIIKDEYVERVISHVQRGMGIIFLHSAHHSKPFKRLLGTSGSLSWREKNEKERIWTIAPNHPIAEGLDTYFELESEEMYGEPFGIPEPETTVFIGWFKGGNVFRSGVTYTREYGKIFYFQPGHETNRAFYDFNVKLIINNAVKWARPLKKMTELHSPYTEELESLD